MSIINGFRNLKIGKNNVISPKAIIHDDVIIGNNNKIFDNVIIYPNTTIGDNNVILNDNLLGEHPVNSKEIFSDKIFNGLQIGDNNFFHVKNYISGGYNKKTIIGNSNKLLAESHIGHDTHIHNNVVLYPRVVTGGLTTLMDYSTIGMYGAIQQNTVLGKYSMIGMNNAASHNIFPFFIYFNGKYNRINKVKISNELDIEKYEKNLLEMISELKENNCDKSIIDKYNLPKNINDCIYEFLNIIKINKL
jgi:acyl-[acyl carrier protein]--UDP-N-acetylglucosamine O-acyltransferase